MYIKPRRKFSSCPNCDMILREEDNFCPKCGQENHHLNVPFFHLVGEFIESVFHIDTKFWSTLKAILKPGKLTNEFVAGKRMSYMPPARMYIMFSFFFFLIINLAINKEIDTMEEKDFNVISSDLKIDGKVVDFQTRDLTVGSITDEYIDRIIKQSKLENTSAVRDTLKNFFKKNIEQAYVLEDLNDSEIHFTYDQLVNLKNTSNFDSLLKVYAGKKELTSFGMKAMYKVIHKEKRNSVYINNNKMDTLSYLSDSVLKTFKYIKDNDKLDSIIRSYKLKPDYLTRAAFRRYHDYKNFDYQRDLHLIINQMTKFISYVMFILMPFIALILLAVNYRKKRYYYEYLIFSIHTHSVLFLFCILEIIIRMIFKSENFLPLFSILAIAFYIPISLKNVYKESWVVTILKYMLISFVYTFIFFMLFVFVLLYSAISF